MNITRLFGKKNGALSFSFLNIIILFFTFTLCSHFCFHLRIWSKMPKSEKLKNASKSETKTFKTRISSKMSMINAELPFTTLPHPCLFSSLFILIFVYVCDAVSVFLHRELTFSMFEAIAKLSTFF